MREDASFLKKRSQKLLQFGSNDPQSASSQNKSFLVLFFKKELLLCLLCLIFFAWRAHHGLRYATFGDETMHFVGAQVLLSGGILYRDFIEVHGPLAYAIPQAYGAIFGWREPLNARAIMIVLTLGAAASVAFGACLRGAWERLLALALFLGLTTTVWLIQGLCLYDYQPVSGALLLIGVALGVAPWWVGEVPGSRALFAAGLCFGLVPFVAFSYGPPSVLLLASAAWAMARGKHWRAMGVMAGGVFTAAAVTLCWMLRYADLRGYVVFHFIHAMVDFGPYLQYGPIAALKVLRLSAAPDWLVQSLAVVAGGIGFAALLVVGRRGGVVPLLLGLAGVVEANGRASNGFQNGAFVLLAFGVCALALPPLPRRAGLAAVPMVRNGGVAAVALLITGAELVARHARASPQAFLRADLRDLPKFSLARSDVSWAVKVREVSAPGEPILAVPFYPDIYFRVGRPPMRRYVYYLPWDADYARHPWLGIAHDLCADVKRDPPPVIYDNFWVVWGSFDPRQYMACLTPILATMYRPMPGEPDFYVRADRVARLQK